MVKRLVLIGLVVVVAAVSAAFSSGNASELSWQLSPTGSTARLRGLSAVSHSVAWASGSLGTVLRTTNGGSTWQSVGPPGTAALQFRDIEAFDANNAVILSIGNGTDSRVYVTRNGGATWTLAFQNTDPNAFYDCMTFFDKRHGLALSDPVGGKFRIISTSDGGNSWHVVDADMPPALPAEFAFAASGQCLVSSGKRDAWFATGGDAVSRVFRSSNRGKTWRVATTPIPSGPTAGIFALAFREDEGIAVGGDFLTPTVAPDAAARTRDGGRAWKLAKIAPNEYRSGVTWVDDETAIAVGPTGSNVSEDEGRTWRRFDTGSFDTVDCARHSACWASGEQGRVASLISSDDDDTTDVRQLRALPTA